MYYLIYKTTNLITNKYYIGKHKTANINDKYLGSGLVLKQSVKKYGRDAHIREIIHFCESYETMTSLEKEIVNLDLLNDPNCMNIRPGGDGGTHGKEKEMWTQKNKLQMAKAVSDSWKDPNIRKLRTDNQKLSALKPENILRQSTSSKAMWASPEFRDKYNSEIKPLIFTEEYKKQMSISCTTAFKDPAKKANLIRGQKRKWADPEYQQRMKLKRAETAATPEFRAALSAGVKRKKERIIQELIALNLDYTIDGWQEHIVRVVKSTQPERWLKNNIHLLKICCCI